MTHVLIVSLRRSGGKLMRMLLDGHSQVNAFPFEHWNRASKLTFPERRIAAFDRLSVEDKLRTAGDRVVEKKLRRLHSPALAATVIDGWRRDAADAATLPELYESLARRYFAALHLDPNRRVVNHCGSACVLKGIGASCTTAPECASGFCEQGVCCGSACGGTCKSCALPASLV